MPYSSNGTFLVRLDHDGANELAIYKPVRGERPLWDFPSGLARREVAAYELSTALGWDVVPPTVLRDGPHGEGSVQRFIDADFSEHYFTLREDGTHDDAFRRLCAFDLVANSADRKGGHCLIDAEGHIWAIDNGLSFHQEFKVRTVIWDYAGERLPDDVAADLQALVDTRSARTAAPSSSTPSNATPSSPGPAPSSGPGPSPTTTPATATPGPSYDPHGAPPPRSRSGCARVFSTRRHSNQNGHPPVLVALLCCPRHRRATRTGSSMLSVDEAAAQGDLDELVRHVDRLCSTREWDELVRLRDKAKAAIERGHQLWPAASWAEYRLALEAPGRVGGHRARRGVGLHGPRPAARGGGLDPRVGRIG